MNPLTELRLNYLKNSNGKKDPFTADAIEVQAMAEELLRWRYPEVKKSVIKIPTTSLEPPEETC